MNPIPRRTLLSILITGSCVPWQALAQSPYPNQPIKLVVPYAPGGVPDTTARLLAQKLQNRVGQSVVVENRAGGNGSVAASVYAMAHPGELNYGSAGIGSTHQLTMEAMKSALHLNITHVPYRGTSQAVPALLGNHVQVLWASYPNLKAGVEGGKIRLLANNGLGHSPLLPELPPLADIIPGFDMVSVIGVYGRTDTPDPIVRKIAAEASAIMKDPEMKSTLAPLGMEPVGEGPELFAKMIAQEVNSIAKVVESVGLKAK